LYETDDLGERTVFDEKENDEEREVFRGDGSGNTVEGASKDSEPVLRKERGERTPEDASGTNVAALFSLTMV
jgi:hypothetical protein